MSKKNERKPKANGKGKKNEKENKAKKPVTGKTVTGRNKSSGQATPPAKRTVPKLRQNKAQSNARKKKQEEKESRKNGTPIPKKETTPKAKKNKNVSKIIPNGRILQTRDEYFEHESGYRKPEKEEKGNYRKAVVVDSNRNDELAVVKLITSKNATPLPNYKNGESRYRPFIETKDNKGDPIKIGGKFIPKSADDDMSKSDVNKIKKHALKESSPKLSKENRKKLRALKNRQ